MYAVLHKIRSDTILLKRVATFEVEHLDPLTCVGYNNVVSVHCGINRDDQIDSQGSGCCDKNIRIGQAITECGNCSSIIHSKCF